MEWCYGVAQELNTVKELVEYTLENYPETRNSDTTLYLKCCEILGARDMKDLYNLNLNIISVHKIRQVIQNKEHKYKSTEDIQMIRKQRAKDIREYIKNLQK